MYTYREHRKRLKHHDSEGGKVAYIDEGKGPVIMLVHGVPTSSWLYRHIIPDLVAKGYRVVAPDLLGYGGSDKPPGFEIYHEQKQGHRLLSLMKALQVDQWLHVFHDVGGLWSWEMLKLDSTKVAGLVVLNTIIYEAGFKPPMRFEKGAVARFYTNLYRWKITNGLMINATLKNGLTDDSILGREDRLGYRVPMLEGGNRALYYFFTQTCKKLPPDYDELLRGLGKPAQVIWGEHDPMLKWPPQSTAVMADLELSDENVRILKDASHFIQEERPREIVNEIVRFAGQIGFGN